MTDYKYKYEKYLAKYNALMTTQEGGEVITQQGPSSVLNGLASYIEGYSNLYKSGQVGGVRSTNPLDNAIERHGEETWKDIATVLAGLKQLGGHPGSELVRSLNIYAKPNIDVTDSGALQRRIAELTKSSVIIQTLMQRARDEVEKRRRIKEAVDEGEGGDDISQLITLLRVLVGRHSLLAGRPFVMPGMRGGNRVEPIHLFNE